MGGEGARRIVGVDSAADIWGFPGICWPNFASDWRIIWQVLSADSGLHNLSSPPTKVIQSYYKPTAAKETAGTSLEFSGVANWLWFRVCLMHCVCAQLGGKILDFGGVHPPVRNCPGRQFHDYFC